jgi:hypothetical protein
MKSALMGLLLTVAIAGGAWWLGGASAGRAAALAGLVAAAIETAAVSLLAPTLEPPFDRALKRWAYGLALRMTGAGAVGVAVLWQRRFFPPLPTVIGFLGVLLPLLVGEMRLVVTKLRATR